MEKVRRGKRSWPLIGILALMLTTASCASGKDTVAAGAAEPPGASRESAETVRNNQEPPATRDVAVLARGKGPQGGDVALVAYKSKAGASCWGWSAGIPGQASICFGPRDQPSGDSLYLMHQTFLAGEPPTPSRLFVYGAGPRGTASFRFEVKGEKPIVVPAQTSSESAGRGLPHFLRTIEPAQAVTVVALDDSGRSLDSDSAQVDGPPSLSAPTGAS